MELLQNPGQGDSPGAGHITGAPTVASGAGRASSACIAQQLDAAKPANNFGVLRLALACLVIIGHAPEQIDGNSQRDVIHRIAGQGTLGSLAVTGFFLLSGYLITMSMVRTGRVAPYFGKRLLRIVPGFVVAYVLTVFVLAPALGAPIGEALRRAFIHLIFLRQPPTFFTIEPHYRTINGALWTISFEFRCYLLVALLWVAGILRQSRWMLVLTAFLAVGAVALRVFGGMERVDRLADWRPLDLMIGTPSTMIDFALAFLIGACIYLYHDHVLPRLTGWSTIAALAAMLLLLTIPGVGLVLYLFPAAIAVFWLALGAEMGRLRWINGSWDISYGTYLYGWPAAMVVLVLVPGISAISLAFCSLPMALAAGAASWWLVERRFKMIGETALGMRLRWRNPADQPAI